MLIPKKISNGLGFARKEPYVYNEEKFEADLKNGDTVVILDEGNKVTNIKGGVGYQFKIKTRNGEKNTNINQSSLNVLNDEFGADSKDWVGKEVNVILKKGIVAGEKRILSYFVTDGWSLDDYGQLVKEGSQTADDEGIDSIDFDEDPTA